MLRVIDVKAKDLKEGMKVSTVDIQGNKIYQPITKVETKYSFSIVGMKLEGKDKKTGKMFVLIFFLTVLELSSNFPH